MITITRFALTHDTNGISAFCFANQGRNHYDTREAAEADLALYRESLTDKLGMRNLAVRSVLCYEHGDAVGTFFDVEEGAFA